MSEYRLWITVPDLRLEAEDRWEGFIRRLEHVSAEMGPILSWDERGEAQVVVSLDTDSHAHAVGRAVTTIADALHQTGLRDRYPTAVEIEAPTAHAA